SVQQADLICVLHRGRIVERGTHAELLELDGRYAELFRLQEELARTGLATSGRPPGIPGSDRLDLLP
ncbi:MAG: hypothetical protein JO144_17010, partial [Actinobacteria bacterium]|nr:hypothetical protein [Actinomycetota bacterium]